MNHARSLIGVSCCRRMDAAEPVHGVVERYVLAASEGCNADTVLVPALATDSGLAMHLDGLILTGSPSNLEPDRSGIIDGEGPYDPQRDVTNLKLAGDMLDEGKPVFGICRGLQELNVLFGGTIKTVNATAHHSKESSPVEKMFAHEHPVAIEPGGVLSKLFGANDITVNSVHFQGIDRLGNGLMVEATAPDGQIEAFSDGARGLVLAVQWHPEWDVRTNKDSSALFSHFAQMVKASQRS